MDLFGKRNKEKKDKKKKGGEKSLVEACHRDDPKLAITLLRSDAELDLEEIDEAGYTPLTNAAYEGHLEVVKLLVERHCDINAPNKHGETALVIGAWKGHLDIVRHLLQSGADLERQSEEGDTALTASTFRNRIEVVRALINDGADCLKRNLEGECCVTIAARDARLEILEMVVAKGVTTTILREGKTALQRAFEDNWSRQVVSLLKSNLEVDKEVTSAYFASTVMPATPVARARMVHSLLGNDDEHDDELPWPCRYVRLVASLPAPPVKEPRDFQPPEQRWMGQLLSHALDDFLLPLESPRSSEGVPLQSVIQATLKFIGDQVKRAADETQALKGVYRASRNRHAEIFESVVQGISSEISFQHFAVHAAAVAKRVASRNPSLVQKQNTVQTLYEAAQATHPRFTALVHAIANKSDCKPDDMRLKGMFRTLERAVYTDPKGLDVSSVLDVVRAHVECGTTAKMAAFLTLLCSCDKEGLGGLGGVELRDRTGRSKGELEMDPKTPLTVLAVNNALVEGATAFSACTVRFVFADGPPHICEVMLVHERMATVAKQMNSWRDRHRFLRARELLLATNKKEVVEGVEKEESEKQSRGRGNSTMVVMEVLLQRLDNLEGGMRQLSAVVEALGTRLDGLEDRLDVAVGGGAALGGAQFGRV